MQSRPEIDKASTAPTVKALNEKSQNANKGTIVNNSTEVVLNRVITVPFHGADLHVIEHNGEPYTPMKPIVSAMGLDWGSQFRKVAANEARWGVLELRIPASTVVDSTIVGSADGKSRELTCIPVRKVAAWLTTIEPGKVKNPAVRNRVIQYQNECDDALWQYWNDGLAVNPRAFSMHAGQTLAAEQADELRQMVEGWAKKLSPDTKVQGKFIMQAWSKLKSHFKVGYRQIPQESLAEALSIVGRHAAEWEVVDDVPTLPRLTLHLTPPAINTYRYNPANPHPINGRTIEVAKSIASDIRNWSDGLPICPARKDLQDAAQTLYDLLVTGWTEVDEALGHMHVAMHYLNRWQGRGGRIGNVS